MIHVALMRVVLQIPGARSLKDGRAVLNSVRDRVRHRFDVSVAEVELSEQHDRRVLAIATIGNDPRLLRSIVDKISQYLNTSVDAIITGIDVEILPWQPHDRWVTPRAEGDEEG
jgi:uncharacterized protein YlxP (DUF503 family)